MPWGVAAAVGAVGGALISSSASRKASDQAARSAASADQTERDQYNQTREDYAPYREAGYAAVHKLNNLVADPSTITSDPGYQFGLNQGVQGVDRSAASKGGLYSGATLKALNRYGQDYAGTKLNDTFTRYGSVAQLGATGTQGTAYAGTNAANSISGTTNALGSNLGNAALNQGNIWSNALNQVASKQNGSPYGSRSGSTPGWDLSNTNRGSGD